MVKVKTMNTRLFTISVGFYALALLIYGFWSNSYQKKEILESIDTKLYNNAISLKYILPDDFHDRAIDAQSVSINENKYIARKLTRLVKEAGFKYTYTIIKKDDKLFFIAADNIDPENERDTFYYYEYEEADEVFINAFEKKTPTYMTVTDQWGTVRTVIVPETSPGGIKYLACVDYDIDYVDKLLEKNLIRSILTVLFFLLLAVPVIKFYISSYKEFSKSLKKSEKKYRNLFESSMDAIFLMDSEFTYLDCNPASLKLYNVDSKKQFLTLNPIELSPTYQIDGKLSSKKADEMIEQTMKNNHHFFEWKHKKFDGHEFDANVKLSWIEIDGRKVFQGTVRDISDQKQAQKKLIDQTEEIRQTQKVSVKALAILSEHYDSDTGEHLTRIQSYVELLVKWLRESSHFKDYLTKKTNYIDALKLACLLHDVGKTAIPIEILTKPGKLTDEEFEIVKSHTTIAGEALTTANNDFKKIFRSDSYLAMARDIALYHHEKWNGKGYPKGLSDESIPLSARIVAVADVYDALRSKRPYKEPWSHVDAVNEIIAEKGKHFDPEIIRGFISQSDKFHTISKKFNEEIGEVIYEA
ncbi:HD domain-containing phosphohydrolase [Desulfobacterales bacterium HSG17]|nr:HD domain-containing phosphohydrolase [Desulfobacterales bacterium HSG17]